MNLQKLGLALAAVALSLTAACGGPALTEEFVIVNGAEPSSLDPALVEGVPEHRINLALFEGLVGTDPKTGRAVPGVAESWTVSDDGTVYTFKLRSAVWSDGVPITADTVVKSWLRTLDPATASPYAWFPAMFLKGAEAFNAGEADASTVAIRAVDPQTFEMTLVGPLPYALDALNHYAFGIVPIHAIEKFGANWTKPENFVGNGPFVLSAWMPQERLEVVPNPLYWDKDAVKLAKVVYLPIDDNNVAYTMYLNGEVDWMTTVPLDQMSAAKLRPDYVPSPQLGTYYYIFNTTRAPFNDARVRRALAMAINRQEMIDNVTQGGQLPAYTMVPELAGYTPSAPLTENLEQARALLAEAGFPNGRGFPAFAILYNTSEAHKKIGEYIQAQWKTNLGIDVSLVNEEWATYLDTRDKGNFAVARAGWVGDYQDPNTFLDMFVTGSGSNDGKYSNPAYDALIAQAATMPDGAARMEVMRQAETLLIPQDMAVMPIYFYTNHNMIDLTKWSGWYPNIMDFHPLKGVAKK